VNYRLFVCIELPGSAREALAALQDRLRREGGRVSWVPPKNMHLTLVFLGDVDASRVSSIGEVLQQAVTSYEPFEIRLQGSGAFPSLNRPRVLWVGVSGALDALQSVHVRLTNGLAEVGLQGDTKPFSPHLTLGRVKDDRDPLLRAVTSTLVSETIQVEPFTVSEILLMRSELDPQGARYTTLHRAPLVPR
jgi:RNA 2',3'-cyclic 3'-phosphodiesterase